jgi:regulator of replication initiation timing
MSEEAPKSSGQSERIAELLKQLHAANEHFATARRHLESLMDCTEYDHPPHDGIENDLRNANAELQRITTKIHELLSEPTEKKES